MSEFASLHSYQQFERSVKTNARFVPDGVVIEFLKSVLESIEPRLKPLPMGTILFRAQRGFIDTTEMVSVRPVGENPGEENEECVGEEFEVAAKAALPLERMVPKAECVGDGLR